MGACLDISVSWKVYTGVAMDSALASLSGFLGKLMTHQIPVEIGVALVLGAVPGAQIGSILSRRAPAPFLRGLLAIIIILVAIRMGYQTLQSR